MKIGIVGHEAAKFTPDTEAKAKQLIKCLLDDDALFADDETIAVSGHCPLGGIDIWTEEIADEYGYKKLIFPPAKQTWAGGYRERNLLIAQNSDIVHCISVASYPDSYTGLRFNRCYHCGTNDHAKGGGCWTMKQAIKLGKKGELWIIN